MSAKVYIGFITYNDTTAKYLPDFLASLKNQTFKDFSVICVDNSDDQHNDNSRFLEETHRDIKLVWAGKNLGFGAAYNLMITEAMNAGAEFFLVINPDTILQPDALDRMVSALVSGPSLGSICPKLLRWDFSNNIKTKIIDSCGIRLTSGLHFIDVGQGLIDRGQFDRAEITGPSGAAGLFRLSDLQLICEADGQYFDEHFFMYKEDCDLAYRLKLAGRESRLVPEAVIYHDRTSAANGHSKLAIILARKWKSSAVRQWSFFNQQILYLKFWSSLSLKNKLAVCWYELQMIGFALLFEREIFAGWRRLIDINKSLVKYKK